MRPHPVGRRLPETLPDLGGDVQPGMFASFIDDGLDRVAFSTIGTEDTVARPGIGLTEKVAVTIGA
jgi:hypothetical protein